MPQMMPLSWLMLFMFFSMMFLLFNIMNYFSHNPMKIFGEKKMINMKSMNWKW
uniref:ATP synthase complex subunit 8 n=1 Tax=Neostylopyga rhombifolia TaxID=304879 RepID=A0A2P1H8A2_NEORO|nr:ATP synthase F0 subunit 8 [Neostylopyga rhombifolia]WAX39353.1 ATP synthase F0 subunit 8 [Neostylopyga rhombifolia]